MTRILWCYKNNLTREQFRELKKMYGDSIYVKDKYGEINSWQEVAREGLDCDVFAGVFPQKVLCDLLEFTDKPVLRPSVIGVSYINSRSNTVQFERVMRVLL